MLQQTDFRTYGQRIREMQRTASQVLGDALFTSNIVEESRKHSARRHDVFARWRTQLNRVELDDFEDVIIYLTERYESPRSSTLGTSGEVRTLTIRRCLTEGVE